MSTISVSVRGLSGVFDLEVPPDATVADVRAAANLNDGLSLRTDGATIEDESSTPVRDEQILVATAPEAKHGLR
jgi:hypothetical protein